jgi:4-amino-4-deoxy-L-arabinose transferase-like glycosyltransferase
MTGAATRKERIVDGAIFCALWVGYVLLLLTTVKDLGYARDEGFYFSAAKQYGHWFERLFSEPTAALERATVDRYWKANNEHPAFVKSLFALSHRYLHQKWGLFAEGGTAFRFPGMVLSGMAVAVLYRWGRQTVGRVAGFVAAFSFAFMPRIFYHAHLDCFDMPVAAMWLLTTYVYWLSLERGGLSRALAAGLLYGLLLNTKHNAWLLPPALIVHFLISRGFRGLMDDLRSGVTRVPLGLLCMVVLGPLVFFSTWPWLWNDTAKRFAAYVAFHTGHDYYNMEFLGVTYFRPPMPRLYAWVMTVATVPTVTLGLFVAGLVRWFREDLAGAWARLARLRLDLPGLETRRARGSTRLLWLLCIVTSYAPWVSTQTPIFGGTKHWITAYPFVCLFAAAGFDWIRRGLVSRLGERRGVSWALPAALMLSVLAAPVTMALHAHPWGLGYYVPLVGGTPGAASLGLNRTFWGYTTGALTDVINERAPARARVYLHDTAQESWQQMQRDGRIRDDLRGTLTLHASDLALYHHEQHMQRVEYQYWVDYGTVSPVHVGLFDGVPMVWLYQRPERAPAARKARAPRPETRRRDAPAATGPAKGALEDEAGETPDDPVGDALVDEADDSLE